LSDLGSKVWIPVQAARKKHSLTPLLVVVFLASYGLMTWLIVNQGETIQSQKNLIEVLLGDSRELWALKGKAQVEKFAQSGAEAQSRSQSPTKSLPSPQGQVPSSQLPSTQIPSTQAPSSKASPSRIPSTQVPQHQLQNRAGKTVKPEDRAPQTQVPPMPASDLSDQRRVVKTL